MLSRVLVRLGAVGLLGALPAARWDHPGRSSPGWDARAVWPQVQTEHRETDEAVEAVEAEEHDDQAAEQEGTVQEEAKD